MEKRLRKLVIDAEELYFSAAHYLPDYPGLCGFLHGHTYFVKNLEIHVLGFVDLGAIKKAVKYFDHCTLIPSRHRDSWDKLIGWLQTENSPIYNVLGQIMPIEDSDIPGTTVEMIAEALHAKFMEIEGVKEVHFNLYEGPTAGREI